VGRIHARYYTDPASPGSWGLEPALRRLTWELGDELRMEPVMAGLAREFGPPLGQVRAWLDVAETSGMPVDPRLWLASPPASSYPACMAVKAAAEQGPAVEAAYLRRLREGFACGRRKLDTSDALIADAREVPGCDVERFGVDLSSHAVVEAFGADLERAGSVAESARDPDTSRARIPSLEFRGEDGAVHEVHGSDSYEELRTAAQAAGAAFDGKAGRPGVEDALRRFGTLATVEVAAVCDLPGPRAAAELWRLAGEWRVRSERQLTGELWSPAKSRHRAS
jgi:predicted DsbA family dithiol-disulfide isomerase